MNRIILVVFLCASVSACATSPKRTATAPIVQSTPVPHPDVFARDRNADSGFPTAKQAAFKFIATLFDARNAPPGSQASFLLNDEAFTRQFLSAYLRQIVASAIQLNQKHFVPGGSLSNWSLPDISNQALFAAWDLPTSYRMASGHETGDTAVYDVIYSWGQDTQYPGDIRVTSVVLRREGHRWYVDDLYTHAGKFTRAQSLLQSLDRAQ